MQCCGVSPLISVPIAAVVVWGLTVFGYYSRAERAVPGLTLAFLAYPIAAFPRSPQWRHSVTNLVLPHFLGTHAFLLLAVALDRHHDHPLHAVLIASAVSTRASTADDYRDERIDTVTGAICRRRDQHLHHHRHRRGDRRQWPAAVGQQAAEALQPGGRPRPRPHCSLSGCGRFAAGRLGGAVVDLVRDRRRAGVAAVVVARASARRPFLRYLHAAVVVGAAIALAPAISSQLVINAQVLNGIITPLLLTYILIMANRRHLLGSRERAHFQDRRHGLRRRGRLSVACRARRDADRPWLREPAQRPCRNLLRNQLASPQTQQHPD